MPEKKYQGAFDNRTPEQKAKDFKWDEVNVSGAITLQERPSIGYSPRNQDGSGSCVAQTIAKMLEVWDYKHDNDPTVYSATPIYQKRSNRPTTGMIGVDALQLAVNGNVYLEENVPSQNMSDAQMDAYVMDGATKRDEHPTNYLVMAQSFDQVIQEVRQSGAVMTWVKCDYQEWCKDIPVQIYDNEGVRHSVCAVDAISFKGADYLIVEDSWGTWQKTSDIPIQPGQRAVSRDFFDRHVFFTACFTAFEFVGGLKPRHYWHVPMRYGQQSNDIKKWQEMLKYEKFFPSNQECTGYFGGITARATKAWQIAHKIYDFKDETDMRRITAGPKSMREANRLYP